MDNQKEKIRLLAMKDTVESSNIALPIIMLFEAYMMINWVVTFEDKTSLSSLLYLFGYISLFLVSGVVLIAIRKHKKNIDNEYMNIMFMQNAYSIFIVLWSLMFTYVGAVLRGHFSIIIFVTIITIVPVFTYLEPWMTVAIQTFAGFCVIALAMFCKIEHMNSFIINFAVLIIISCVAGISFYNIRKKAYQRQLQLEQMTDETNKLAYMDALTELYNRRSYDEDLDALADNGLTDNLVFGSFDLNELKHANDTYGHLAGDELIIAAAKVIYNAFSKYGKIYRVGGDEFCAILNIDKEELLKAEQEFNLQMDAWRGKYSGFLSVSYGFSVCDELKNKSLREIVTIADEAMYKMKNEYHVGVKNDKN